MSPYLCDVIVFIIIIATYVVPDFYMVIHKLALNDWTG